MEKLKKALLGLFCFIGILIFIPMQAKAATVSEHEPNELKTEANEINVGDTYVGEIGSYKQYRERDNGDSDYIKIFLEGNKTYKFTMDDYFYFFDDTTLIIGVISPSGGDVAGSFDLVHDQYENKDYCYLETDESGYYYIHFYNYVDFDTRNLHYYTFSISEDENNASSDWNGLYADENGDMYYYKDGNIDWSYTGLWREEDSYWYVKNGKVDFDSITLCKYDGTWWYVEDGTVDFNTTTLCKYNGTWWYVKNGRIDFSATTLCKYNGVWWYVRNGKIDFNTTTLCKYNGTWWYVKNGKVDFSAATLCKYNGIWWYVKNGKIDFSATTLCKYNGNWFYVSNGRVIFTTTLCKYNGIWFFINNGVVNFNKTTLVKYNGNWFAVAGGRVVWGYTGNIDYKGGKFKVINGIVKF